MNRKDRNTLHLWSKRFASLRPFHRQPNGEINPLPRFVQSKLPRFVRACPTTMSATSWLRLLSWEKLPASSTRQWFNRQPILTATYIAAYLIKLEHKLPSMGHLRRFLVAHPALI